MNRFNEFVEKIFLLLNYKILNKDNSIDNCCITIKNHCTDKKTEVHIIYGGKFFIELIWHEDFKRDDKHIYEIKISHIKYKKGLKISYVDTPEIIIEKFKTVFEWIA